MHLNWGGRLGVAKRKPREGTDPEDRAYDWHLYDRIVLEGERHGVEVLFTIFGTPPWANGGQAPTHAPRNADPLREFAYAAATRYSGTYERADGVVLPRVRYWTAWNEPNLQIGLIPQWRRVGGKWIVQSAIDYARICNAVVEGIRTSMLRGQKVACGATAARGNNNPKGLKPSVSPLAFLRAMKKAGATGFDAYAHHPYYGGPGETPATPSPGRGGVTLGNIDALVSELTRLYGRKRIWITEYGYQTNPPDGVFGVSWSTQAAYVRQSFAIARAHPRIDMLLWFLLQDEADPERWQSGLISATGERKPSFNAFRESLALLPARCPAHDGAWPFVPPSPRPLLNRAPASGISTQQPPRPRVASTHPDGRTSGARASCDQKSTARGAPRDASHHRQPRSSAREEPPSTERVRRSVQHEPLHACGTERGSDACTAQRAPATIQNLRPGHSRIFVRKSVRPPAPGKPEAPEFRALMRTIELAQQAHANVNLTWWQGPYASVPKLQALSWPTGSNGGSKWPKELLGGPGALTGPKALMEQFADIIQRAHAAGHRCVTHVTIQNEVNQNGVDIAQQGNQKLSMRFYELLYRHLDSALKARPDPNKPTRPLRACVQLVGGDLVNAGNSKQRDWIDYMARNMADVLNGYSIHVYWQPSEFPAKPLTRLRELKDTLDDLQIQKPMYVTEYGVKINGASPEPGQVAQGPIEQLVDTAFQHAWFNAVAPQHGCVGLVKWLLYRTDKKDVFGHWGMIDAPGASFTRFPTYVVTWLFTHFTEPGWKAPDSGSPRAASSLRAGSLRPTVATNRSSCSTPCPARARCASKA